MDTCPDPTLDAGASGVNRTYLGPQSRELTA